MSFLDPRSAAPADHAEAVTPSDTVSLAAISRKLYVGGAGNVSVLFVDGSTATFVGVPTGTVLPIRVSRVNTTGTTATSLIALS